MGVDPIEDAGAPFVSSTRSVLVQVTDGSVSIDFQTLPKLGYPKVSAIEVLSSTAQALLAMSNADGATEASAKTFEPIRINCGSEQALTDSLGQVWQADRNFRGKRTGNTNHVILGTANAPLFQTNRWGDFSYEIPVPSGDYEVVLWFAEIWYAFFMARVFVKEF